MVSEQVRYERSRQKRALDLAQMRAESQRLLQLADDKGCEAVAIDLGRYCEYCGAPLVPTIKTIDLAWEQGRRRLVFPDRCGCAREKHALAVAEEVKVHAVEMQQRARHERRLANAGLIGWLAQATFDTFEAREDWASASELRLRVEQYANAMVRGELDHWPWLILHGNTGTGKSHLAAAVVHRALDVHLEAYLRVWPNYLADIQGSWDRQRILGQTDDAPTQSEIIKELQMGDLVVIDDLDKRSATSWSRDVLFHVLNERYNRELPTILTFNRSPEDADPQAPGRLALEVFVGRSLLDRIAGAAFAVLEFDGPSYRSGASWR